MLFALLLITVFDGDVAVPRSRSRGIPVEIHAAGAPLGVVECRFSAPKNGVLRAFLIRSADIGRLEQGQQPEVLQGTEAVAEGSFRSPALPPGRYTVIVDNRNGPATLVAHVQVDTFPLSPVELDAGRRRQVTLVSLALFAFAAAGIGWRLQRAMRGLTVPVSLRR
jgi:hypothetical protein